MSGIVDVVHKIAQQIPMTNEAIRELQVEQQQLQRKIHDLERTNEQLMQNFANSLTPVNRNCKEADSEGELANIIMLEKPDVKWSDVAGFEMAKKSLKRAVNMVVFSLVK
ncbi:hypothetical protein WR25_05334 [Diploscapter pachys]|uniref:Uncharacterized protein n=1 Tax=Diploscapter pachys TaxID=2018661 RepID=A0A2A2LIW0_9BILA|nr:hypothetical protein WR25_05334 [Diploscapter pachys]